MTVRAPAGGSSIAALRPAAVLTAGAAMLAAIPCAVTVYVLYRVLTHASRPLDLVVAATVLLAALVLRVLVARMAGRLVRHALNARAEHLRLDILAALRHIPARRLREIDAGRIVALLTMGIDEAVSVFADGFEAIFGGSCTALLILLLLALIDWRIALLALAFLPLTAAYLWQSRGISSRAAPRLVRARSEGTSRFFEYVESVSLLRTFGRTTERARRLAWALQELKVKAFETSIAPIPFGVLALFFVEFGFAITLMVGTEVNASAGFAVTRFLLALIVALGYFQTLFDATDGYLRLRDARSTWGELEQLRARTAAEAVTPDPPHRFDIRIEGVGFAYAQRPVLADISCRFEDRGVTAIVGRSGAGKSTLAGVIAGFNEPHSGTVFVGGVDLSALSAHERAHIVTLVFQDTELLAGTVRSNIAAGRPQATDAEVHAAARTARCDEFIARLPAGYDTPLRSGGMNLSLGERQRIAIARALVGCAPIVVFDECTASLDPSAERAVHAAIEALSQRATVVLISHRLATVRNARRIVVLAAGRIVETGTHASLLANGKEYAQLWSAYEAAHAWRTGAANEN